jgi:hypothetical protein
MPRLPILFYFKFDSNGETRFHIERSVPMHAYGESKSVKSYRMWIDSIEKYIKYQKWNVQFSAFKANIST